VPPAFGRNEVPFGRDTLVVPCNIVLDWETDPPWEGKFEGSEPQSKFALQIVAKP